MVGEGRFFDSLTQGNAEVDNEMKADTFITKDGHGKFMRLDFDSVPAYKGKVLANGSTFAVAAPTGAEGDENIMVFPEGTLEYHILGTQSILAPILVGAGLNVGMDQTDNDGVEICGGILACNKLAYTVGTTKAFYAKLKFSIATVAGTDFCLFGFRKVEAYQADFNTYDEMAAFNIKEGVVNTSTAINGGAVVDTDTTLADWADAETHELEIRVSDAGVVTYKYDGITPTTVAAFSFDDTEVVVPFFYMLQANAAQTGAVIFKSLECGLQ